jgi:hypothetical protein
MKPNCTLKQYALMRLAVNLIDRHIRFDPQDHVPLCCYEKCRHFDGKRCGLTGNEPEQTCRPACAKLVKSLEVLHQTLFSNLMGKKS